MHGLSTCKQYIFKKMKLLEYHAKTLSMEQESRYQVYKLRKTLIQLYIKRYFILVPNFSSKRIALIELI